MEETKVVEEKKDKRTFQVSGDKCIVKHRTICADNDKGVWFTWTLDFSKVSREQMMKWAADQRVIALRASAGVKKLTTAELEEKGLLEKEFDLSLVTERTKHVETEEEKELKATIKALTAKGDMSIKDLLAKVKAMQAAAEEKELEDGETTE